MIVCLGPCCVPVHALIPLVLWAARAVLPAAWAARCGPARASAARAFVRARAQEGGHAQE